MIYHNIQQIKVPALGFGTYLLKGSDCERSVEEALQLGYRHIDTARAYENEQQVGNAIKNSGVKRNEIFLTTKLWMDELTPGKIQKATENSLQSLQTNYIDLLLIHWPNPDIDLSATLDKMYSLKNEDLIKNVGVSNFTPDQLENAIEIGPIFCNQVEYHPFLDQSELLNICQRSGILLTAYSPIARGKVNENKIIREIAEEKGKTPSQVTLRWLVQQKNVAAIPKASGSDHRKENFDIFNFELSEEEMEAINKLRKNIRLVDPAWSPDW